MDVVLWGRAVAKHWPSHVTLLEAWLLRQHWLQVILDLTD